MNVSNTAPPGVQHFSAAGGQVPEALVHLAGMLQQTLVHLVGQVLEIISSLKAFIVLIRSISVG